MSNDDLTGQVFGRLTVIDKGKQVPYTVTRRGKAYHYVRQYYKCVCECGNEKEIRSDSLTAKTRPVRSCGCLSKEPFYQTSISEPLESTDEESERLTAIERAIDRAESVSYEIILSNSQKDYGVHNDVHSEKSTGRTNIQNTVWGETMYVENTNLDQIGPQRNTIRSHNSSGVNGVHYHKRDKKWIARIEFQKRQYHIGGFKTLDEATAARKRAEEILYDPMLEKHAYRIDKLRQYRQQLKKKIQCD